MSNGVLYPCKNHEWDTEERKKWLILITSFGS